MIHPENDEGHSRPHQQKMDNSQREETTGLINAFGKLFIDELSKLIISISYALKDNQQPIPMLTYKEAIRYFTDQAPIDRRIQKGAMLKQVQPPQGYLFTQVFLDKDNRPLWQMNGIPYGRTLWVSALDPELIDVFGNKGLVIVE